MYRTGIYAAINMETRARYIGASSRLEDRMHTHYLQLIGGRHPNKAMQADWNTYGADAFVFEVLEVVEDEALLAEAEAHHILLARSEGETLYNSPKGNIYTHARPAWQRGAKWTFRP